MAQDTAVSEVRYRRPYTARHSSVGWNLMLGKNGLWVAKQHGHSIITMLRIYAAWTEGAVEADVAAIERSMMLTRNLRRDRQRQPPLSGGRLARTETTASALNDLALVQPVPKTITEFFNGCEASIRRLTTCKISNAHVGHIGDTPFRSQLERTALAVAIRQTFARRATALPEEKPTAFTESYATTWDGQWRAFLTCERMTAAPPQLASVLADLERFLLPLLETANENWGWKPRAGRVRGSD